MFNRGRKSGGAQPSGDPVSDVHRPVPPAGAAKGHGDVGFPSARYRGSKVRISSSIRDTAPS
jgi:hypothetical protein